jgi:hypothetical protein
MLNVQRILVFWLITAHPLGVPHYLFYISSPDSTLQVKILFLVLKPVGFLLKLEAFLILIFNTLGRARQGKLILEANLKALFEEILLLSFKTTTA